MLNRTWAYWSVLDLDFLNEMPNDNIFGPADSERIYMAKLRYAVGITSFATHYNLLKNAFGIKF